MTTSDTQVQAMRALCGALVSDAGLVRAAYINDWGRFGNFELFVVPQIHDRNSTVRLKAAIRRQLPAGATLRCIRSPEAIRDRNPWTGRTVTRGYRHNHWSVDVDFSPYHEGINRFECQLGADKANGTRDGQSLSEIVTHTTTGGIPT